MPSNRQLVLIGTAAFVVNFVVKERSTDGAAAYGQTRGQSGQERIYYFLRQIDLSFGKASHTNIPLVPHLVCQDVVNLFAGLGGEILVSLQTVS